MRENKYGSRRHSSGQTKLRIRNLDYKVTDVDIKELFEEFVGVKSSSLHCDKQGRSLGSAHVIFERKSEALKAVEKYNGMRLDGRPLKISVDGHSNSSSPTHGFRKSPKVKRLQSSPKSKYLSFNVEEIFRLLDVIQLKESTLKS